MANVLHVLGRANSVPGEAIARRLPHRSTIVSAVTATALSVVYLILPPRGTDLAAQFARADFARAHPLALVDFRWFGGSLPFGYSLWAPLFMSYVGVRLTGALCCVLATVQTTILLRRGGAPRPVFGGVLAAVSQALNLSAGRTTFSLGMVCGLAALLALTSDQRRFGLTPGQRAGVLGFIAAAASPVAAMGLVLCAATLALLGRWRHAALLCVPSAIPVALISGVFGDGGNETFTRHDAWTAALATVAVLVAGSAVRHIRVGALLGLALIAVAYFVDTPVGNNAARFSVVFAIPIVGAFLRWRPVLAGLAIIGVAFPQQVAIGHSLRSSPSARASYYRPLVAAVRAQGPVTGKIEIPETMAHWEDAYVARSLFLARGWIRQVDVGLNGPIFFRKKPATPGQYERWLRKNAVQYVAVPHIELTVPGRLELRTIAKSGRVLRAVWSNAHWTLYAVVAPVALVDSPAAVRRMASASITVSAPSALSTPVRIRWFRWLTLEAVGGDACIDQGRDGYARLEVKRAGTFRIGSSLAPRGHC